MADEIVTVSDTTTLEPIEAAAEVVEQPETSVLGGDLGDDTPADDAVVEPAAADEAPAGAPEKYELIPEGWTIDEGLMGEVEPVLRELNLTNDQANALLPIVPKIMAKASDAAMQSIIDAGAAQRKEWFDAFAADPEIGGSNREATIALAAKGLSALGFAEGHPFRALMTETGFGNHPDMIRTFRALGEMTAEDGTFFRPDGGAKVEAPVWERMYPNG